LAQGNKSRTGEKATKQHPTASKVTKKHMTWTNLTVFCAAMTGAYAVLIVTLAMVFL